MSQLQHTCYLNSTIIFNFIGALLHLIVHENYNWYIYSIKFFSRTVSLLCFVNDVQMVKLYNEIRMVSLFCQLQYHIPCWMRPVFNYSVTASVWMKRECLHFKWVSRYQLKKIFLKHNFHQRNSQIGCFVFGEEPDTA